VSASISLENASPYRNAGLYNTANFIVAPGAGQFLNQQYGVQSYTFLGNSYGGNHIPDIVGNIRLDQKWGSLHFGAAMHTITPGFYGTDATTGHPDDSYGFAVTGAVEFKNLPTGASDSLKIETSYGKGATKYVFGGGTLDTQGGGRFAKYDGNTVGFGYLLDGVFGANGQIQQAETWQVSAFYEHYWNTAWRTSLFGNYSHISYGDGGNALLAVAFGSGVGGGRLGAASAATPNGATAGSISNTTNNFDFAIAQIGTRTAWTPVKNLTLSAEFTYTRLDQNLGGTYTGNVTGKPANQPYEIKDQNLYNGSVQILRSF
jgi:hypothetical protein